jgi:integrase/recombinase XerD
MNDEYINNFSLYLSLERNYSNNTVMAYVSDVSHFSNYIKKDLLNISTKEIEKYLRSHSDLSSKTISHEISSLKSFYNYYIRLGKIHKNPTDEIDTPKIEKKLPTFLTLDEVSLLLDIKVNNQFDSRNKAILELLYSSGIRISELTNLEMANIDLDSDLIRVMGKGSKERVVPLGDYAISAISLYINNYRSLLNKKNSTYVFLNNRGDKISRQFIFKTIKFECNKKGIKKNVSPHTLRHTFATHLLKNGADLRIIQELLGHENIATTQIYTHLTNEKLKDDYNDFYPRS